MSEFNHSLYDDFPKYRDRINQLKLESEDFARMAAEYHKLDHRVRGLEMSGIPVADETFEELKYKRLQLKMDSQRKRSMLQRLSFRWPINVSQEGP